MKNTSKKPVEKAGRKRLDFPTFGSMGQTAKALGVSVNLLKAAKIGGCKAFLTGSRVDTSILIPFLFNMVAEKSDIPAGFASWKDYNESITAKSSAIDLKQKEGSMMDASEAQRQAAEAMTFLFGELTRMSNELPPSLAGHPAVEIGRRVSSEVEKLRKSLTQKFNAIGKSK